MVTGSAVTAAAASGGDRRGQVDLNERARERLAAGVRPGAWPVRERAGGWWETVQAGSAMIIPHWTPR